MLNERWVLTTATCVAYYLAGKKSIRDYSVGFGHKNDLKEIYLHRVPAKQIVRHPEIKVKDRFVQNDIALIELDTPVTFNYTKDSSIGPACLATANYNRFLETKNLDVTENLVVAGYGYVRTVMTYQGQPVLDDFRGEQIKNSRLLVDTTMRDISDKEEACLQDRKKLCTFGQKSSYASTCYGDLGS